MALGALWLDMIFRIVKAIDSEP